MDVMITSTGRLQLIPEDRREALALGVVVGQVKAAFPGGGGGTTLYDGDNGDGVGVDFMIDWQKTLDNAKARAARKSLKKKK